MTDACTRTCQQLPNIPAESDETDPSSISNPVACIEVRDGRDCPVWKNPNDQEVARLIAESRHEPGSLRAVLTEHDLYIWQSVQILHGDFVRQTGVDGVRVRLAPNLVAVNEETVGVTSSFPWIFERDGDLMDVESRREIVERWLNANSRLTALYPGGFAVNWYM